MLGLEDVEHTTRFCILCNQEIQYNDVLYTTVLSSLDHLWISLIFIPLFHSNTTLYLVSILITDTHNRMAHFIGIKIKHSSFRNGGTTDDIITQKQIIDKQYLQKQKQRYY